MAAHFPGAIYPKPRPTPEERNECIKKHCCMSGCLSGEKETICTKKATEFYFFEDSADGFKSIYCYCKKHEMMEESIPGVYRSVRISKDEFNAFALIEN